MKKTFYSNGKLLIIGEYTVLDGVNAFAAPTRFGQYLHIEEGTAQLVKWVSKDADGTVWFEAEIPYNDIVNNEAPESTPEYQTLVKILQEAHKANPALLEAVKGFTVTTELSFPRTWGLGTSSTLINNIAQWFSIDAYKLLSKSFGGSGYDIACAGNNTPLLFKLEQGEPVITNVNFDPPFKNNLFFVYLNRKQNSREAIEAYRKKRKDIEELSGHINSLIDKVLQADDLGAFRMLLEEHEQILAGVLGVPTIKETLFSDFNGTIKSLGAWGGDFVLSASDDNPTPYFEERGYNIIIPYSKMILK